MIPMTDKPAKPKEKIPRWAKILITVLTYIRVPFLCLVALAIGLWIGYSKVGNQPAAEIFNLRTWKHLYDLVFAK